MSEQPLLPRRDVEPLAPPPGSFDAVLQRSRSRRQQRLTAATGVVGVFLAGIWGGLALAGNVNQARQVVVSIATLNRSGGDPAGSTSPLVTTSQAAARRQPRAAGTRGSPTRPAPAARTTRAAGEAPGADAGVSAGQPTARSSGAAPLSDAPTSLTLSRIPSPAATMAGLTARARVVDASGAPVRGIYVYTGDFTAEKFVPSSEPAGTTGVRGRFSVPCTGGPVLLTSWLLNSPLGAVADGAWAARFVSPRTCSAGNTRPSRVVVRPGTTVSGHVAVDPSCSDQTGPARAFVALWLDGDESTAVLLGDLGDGDIYRVSGVPAGTHVLAGDPAGTDTPRTPITVSAVTAVSAVSAEGLTQDLTTTCAPPPPAPTATSPPASIGPTPSSTPSPSLSAATPSPTPTATPDSSAPPRAG